MGTPSRDEALRFETLAIHAGQDPEALYGAVNVPIYQTSTYAQDEVGIAEAMGLRARREPHPRGLRDRARGAGGRRPRRSRSAAGWRPRPRCCSRCSPGTTSCSPTTSTAARYRLLTKVLAPWGLAMDTVDLTDLGALARRA